MALSPDRRVPRKPRIEGEGKGHNIKAYHLTGKLSGASLWNAGYRRLGNHSRQQALEFTAIGSPEFGCKRFAPKFSKRTILAGLD